MNDTTETVSGGVKLCGYIRVSSRGQASDGLGLDVQRQEIKKWAAANGHEITSWCADKAVQGTVDVLAREGFLCVMEKLRSGEATGVVFFDQSRIARALHVQEAAFQLLWSIEGVRVFTVTTGEILADDPDNPTATFIRQILGSVAQFQKSDQNLKMKRGRELKAARGGRTGGRAPYGWMAERGELVRKESEQAVIRRVGKMRDAEMSFQKIADRLNSEGVYNKGGTPWSRQGLFQMYAEATQRIAAEGVVTPIRKRPRPAPVASLAML